MSKEQAIQLLIDAVSLATRRGAYELSEAHQIASAVQAIQETNNKGEGNE